MSRSLIEKELKQKFSLIDIGENETDQMYYERIVKSVDKQLTDDVWKIISKATQKWFNKAVTSLEKGEPIKDPPDLVTNVKTRKSLNKVEYGKTLHRFRKFLLENWGKYDRNEMIREAFKQLKFDLSPGTAENQYYVFKATMEAIEEAGYKIIKKDVIK